MDFSPKSTFRVYFATFNLEWSGQSPVHMQRWQCLRWGVEGPSIMPQWRLRTEPFRRFRSTCHALRVWAKVSPHMLEFLFIISGRWRVSLYKGQERRRTRVQTDYKHKLHLCCGRRLWTSKNNQKWTRFFFYLVLQQHDCFHAENLKNIWGVWGKLQIPDEIHVGFPWAVDQKKNMDMFLMFGLFRDMKGQIGLSCGFCSYSTFLM